MKLKLALHGAGLLLTLGLVAVAVADYPQFQPYGAQRGRIRYFDGPFRSGARVRWGNGLTPIGGQVLIQGFTQAANVITNPNTASLVGTFTGNFPPGTGGGGSQPQSSGNSRSAASAQQTDAWITSIQQSNGRIEANNEEMRNRMNALLAGKPLDRPANYVPIIAAFQTGGKTTVVAGDGAVTLPPPLTATATPSSTGTVPAATPSATGAAPTGPPSATGAVPSGTPSATASPTRPAGPPPPPREN